MKNSSRGPEVRFQPKQGLRFGWCVGGNPHLVLQQTGSRGGSLRNGWGQQSTAY